MTEISQTLQSAIEAFSVWEALAVVFGLAYLILATRENILCWYAALIGTAISIYVFWDASLLMESALQVYYIIMAVYGWYQWRYGSKDDDPLPIAMWRPRTHVLAIVSVLLISAISGYLLARNTQAAWPYLDSFTTWASVLTTYMVAKKILENWIYWLVIDSLSIFLYMERDLYLYSLLFFLYIIIAVFGLLQWQRHYTQQQGEDVIAGVKAADATGSN
ncbi:MAG: nicotinamide riboside transporter PnuC [Pseudomonadales bacterium]|jgi:nicotinamide mononucleotide transporter|nr:nicotinamide riboside transporter PnuC [Pseudomonadales bacterium]MDP7144801.1 nicotinamide riboside transporter PnuC [Pseudomonadales bacterium]MDP7360240.1 nicotinamide riboside transporter PnuC [Pseudomonadales bacterium]MDP7594987.1 nicotinamide riboside transporter PnuC [Pseudomonadales bacterium]HJN53358.1 nicotinamide riboside transporter PnuC [Pseudomonadales bacterium]|tara:strand:+ start:334 stop:990 length:657 start_codon:yes stop_codon:yes gene_type:complete